MADEFTLHICGLKATRYGEPPLQLLHRWRCRGATDLRDKVYALMGLSRANVLPSGDEYSYEISVEELYAEVTLNLIRHNSNLTTLVGRRGMMHIMDPLPSWSIDFSKVLPFAEPGNYFNDLARSQEFSENHSYFEYDEIECNRIT